MSAYLKIQSLAKNEDFNTKIRVATLIAANEILKDTERSDEHAYCKHIVKAPFDDGWRIPIVFAVAQDKTIISETNESISNRSSDDRILDTVRKNITTFSKPSK